LSDSDNLAEPWIRFIFKFVEKLPFNELVNLYCSSTHMIGNTLTIKYSNNFLTEGSVGKGLWIVALPIIISNFLASILEVVDMYFIGKLGDVPIAGGAMSISIIIVLTTVIFGTVTATAAFVSRAYGSERYERIQ